MLDMAHRLHLKTCMVQVRIPYADARPTSTPVPAMYDSWAQAHQTPVRESNLSLRSSRLKLSLLFNKSSPNLSLPSSHRNLNLNLPPNLLPHRLPLLNQSLVLLPTYTNS